MELEPYDFGPVIPDECCDNSDIDDITSGPTLIDSPIRSNFVVIARSEDKTCDCRDRRFTVNLHKDGSWSFTFTNGEPLTDEQINFYCTEIAGAQSYLESQENYLRRGKNIGIWDPSKIRGAVNGSTSDNNTEYYQAGNQGISVGGCKVGKPINVIK